MNRAGWVISMGATSVGATITRIPSRVRSNKRAAKPSGIRMQPWDAGNPGRRLASFLAARHWRPQDPTSSIVEGDPLVAQRNDSHDRLTGDTRLDRLDRVFRPSASGGRMISRYDQRRQTRNDKMRGPQPSLLVLQVYATRRHALPSVWGYAGLHSVDS